MSVVPEHLAVGDTCMSNFDGAVEDGAEEILKQGEVYMGHAAWNFHGRVWWDASTNVFKEELWRYCAPFTVVEASTLRELMDEANDVGGHE